MWKIGKWFGNMATQLLPEVFLPSSVRGNGEKFYTLLRQKGLGEESKAYLQFLLQVLRATATSTDDAQVIPLLVVNIEKLNLTFVEVLRCWASAALAEVKADTAQFITAVIVNFSYLITKFPLGNKASNIEIAITGYEVALTVYTRDAFPIEWAKTQNNLGLAYIKKMLGERANNLEVAIACLQESFLVRTYDAFPVDWAATQNSLATAYFYRITGERANNLEVAIACLQESLLVRTYDAFPVDWAATQNNLGNAHLERILGKRAENFEQAIICYQKALKVYAFEAFPIEWAMMQNNLGNAYFKRILGKRAENFEQAIICYQEALKVYAFEAFPIEWAWTQNNLGKAYSERILGERANNLEVAIACLQEALKVRTYDAFSTDWAATQNSLAAAYSNRIIGERANNLEVAIACLQEALKVYAFDAFPIEWARTQNYLGNVYLRRILGKRANNLEIAIAYYEKALKVYAFDAFPIDWAWTQNHLGLAYFERIIGERANNLETAITYYQKALRVYAYDAFPIDWARTQNSLADAYSERIIGERASNLETAITYYQKALKVYTYDAFPIDWARIQHNLGLTYSKKILGERANNLETAITYYQKALKVCTYDAFPIEWAWAQNHLGNAYLERILGKRADNLEQAIICYQEALKVYAYDAFPFEWAWAQNHLGLAYSTRIVGERAENLERAITYYQEALKVYVFDAFPIEWARTQNYLGLAYSTRIVGERVENLERAITCYQEALKVYVFDAFPIDWAATQNNLGLAYTKRIAGERTENLERAIACYQEALKVRTFDAFPQNHAETLFNLGAFYQEANQLTLAYNTFESAIATVESLREEIVSGEESKRKQAEYFNQVYNRMVEVCLELGNITAAIEYVERSKTRNLVEQILERDSKTIFPADVVTQLEAYRDEITTGQAQIQNGKAENPKVLAQHLQGLRQQRNELQNHYLPIGYGFKFDSFQATLDERTAIIEWYILNDKILAFIIKSTGEVTVWQSQLEDLKAWVNWVNQYLQNYEYKKDYWQNQLGEALKELASILHIDEILDLIPNHCDQLILIPHTALHLFPLHALPVNQNSENSRCLLDLFAGGVSYAPSCQLLQQVQKRERPDFQSLFAIQNPTEDLNYTDLEVQVIQSYFNTSNVLQKTAATLTAINNYDLNTYHCAHFSCHGYFNLENPGKSALILANAPVADTPTNPDSERYLNLRAGVTHDLEKRLTLDKIFSLKLEKCRLVTLSACETGLIDYTNTSDEYIGLPSGFLLAGSPSVVSSLWKVNDLSTSFLMIKFYENLFKFDNLEAGDVAIALKQAQTWLRNLTIEGLDRFLEEPQIEKVLAQLRVGQRILFQESLKLINQRQPLPFANPYYWAGFTASGR